MMLIIWVIFMLYLCIYYLSHKKFIVEEEKIFKLIDHLTILDQIKMRRQRADRSVREEQAYQVDWDSHAKNDTIKVIFCKSYRIVNVVYLIFSTKSNETII